MKDNKINTNKLKISKGVYLGVFFLFLIFGITLGYRCLFDYKATDKVTIQEFINNRNINEEIILPDRGSIYDINGNVLAQDVSSYTLIAYLDESRSEGQDELYHVKDKKMTAQKLSTVINLSYKEILDILNQKGLYQVEFGNAGAFLTELEKDKIESLNNVIKYSVFTSSLLSSLHPNKQKAIKNKNNTIIYNHTVDSGLISA